MISFTAFLRDFFCLANLHVMEGGAGDGRGFERRVAHHFAGIGVRPVPVFSGVRSLGSQSLSGLYHQIDATGTTKEAIVVGEWKAYRGQIPKNELMRFKAATDDYWLQLHAFATAPVMRVFGGTGLATPALRRYAAQWGICLVTADRWPAPILASLSTRWPVAAPSSLARRYLSWLSRPLGRVWMPQSDGSWVTPRPLPPATIDHFLTLHDRWSDQLWRRFNGPTAGFEDWLREMIPLVRAA